MQVKEERTEDAEGRFVRDTYATLDHIGVAGDGFVEGIERTRAKSGMSLVSPNSRKPAVDFTSGERSKELSTDEQRVLQSLDRYGFFVVPSHDRLVSLPKDKFSKSLSPLSGSSSKTDARHPASPNQLKGLPPSTVSPKEARRIAKWGRMLEAGERDQGGNILRWRVKTSKEGKLRERVFKGVPDRWRAGAWGSFVDRWVGVGDGSWGGGSRLSRLPGKGKGKAVERLDQLGREYRDALDRPSSYDVQIDLDVPRTISGHVMFRTRYGLGCVILTSIQKERLLTNLM